MDVGTVEGGAVTAAAGPLAGCHRPGVNVGATPCMADRTSSHRPVNLSSPRVTSRPPPTTAAPGRGGATAPLHRRSAGTRRRRRGRAARAPGSRRPTGTPPRGGGAVDREALDGGQRRPDAGRPAQAEQHAEHGCTGQARGGQPVEPPLAVGPRQAAESAGKEQAQDDRQDSQDTGRGRVGNRSTAGPGRRTGRRRRRRPP